MDTCALRVLPSNFPMWTDSERNCMRGNVHATLDLLYVQLV